MPVDTGRRPEVRCYDHSGVAQVLWDTGDALRAVAGLPVAGPLGERTVVVPDRRVAHALRRAMASSAPPLLTGTRLATAAPIAEEILRAAGVAFAPGEEALRRARVRAVLACPPPLRYF